MMSGKPEQSLPDGVDQAAKPKLRRQLTDAEKAWQARANHDQNSPQLGTQTKLRLQKVRRADVKPFKLQAWMLLAPLVAIAVVAAGLYLARRQPAPLPQKLPMATLTAATGGVRLERDGQFLVVTANMEVFGSDVLQAEPKGRARVVFPDGTGLAIEGGARVKIWEEDQSQRLYLSWGLIECEAAKRPPERSMKLLTPHGEAETTGAKFRLLIDEGPAGAGTGTALLVVDQGKVSLKVKAGQVSATVAENQYAEAKEGLKPEPKDLIDRLDWWREVNWRGHKVIGEPGCGEWVEKGGEQRLIKLKANAAKVADHAAGGESKPEHLLSSILLEPDIRPCHEMRMRFRPEKPQPDGQGGLLLGISPGKGVGLRLHGARSGQEGSPAGGNRLILVSTPHPAEGNWVEGAAVPSSLAFQDGKEYLMQVRIKPLSKRLITAWGKVWEASAKEPDWMVRGILVRPEGDPQWGVHFCVGNEVPVMEVKGR